MPALAPVVEALRTGDGGQRLRGAVELLLAWPEQDRADLVDGGRGGGSGARPAGRALGRALPGRPRACVVALLLNHVRLRPDEAVFMPAGNLHAYLCGLGVEVMAASDNVLRGGLTPKHVDVAETAAGAALRGARGAGRTARSRSAPGLLTWPVPVADFALVKADATAGGAVDPARRRARGSCVCVRGPAQLRTGDVAPAARRAGRAVFVDGRRARRSTVQRRR